MTDAILLAAIVVASCLPYVHRIGFYSDDWAFLASLEGFGDLSHVGRPEIIEWSAYLKPRPVQIGCPAPVFEASWDLTGALEILHDDLTIMADVTSTERSLDASGVTTEIYGSIRARYPYGPDLAFVGFPEGRKTILTTDAPP